MPLLLDTKMSPSYALSSKPNQKQTLEDVRPPSPNLLNGSVEDLYTVIFLHNGIYSSIIEFTCNYFFQLNPFLDDNHLTSTYGKIHSYLGTNTTDIKIASI